MALQPTQHPADSGAINFNTVANGDTANYGNGTNVVLLVQNTEAVEHTLTLDPAGSTAYGDALPSHTVTVPSGVGKVVAVPLRRDYDNGATSNTCTLSFDDATKVKVAVLQVP